MKEYALIFSAVPATVFALIVLSIPPSDSLASQWLTGILDTVCSSSIPTFWCRVPRPAPWMAAVQAADYLVFVLVSIYYVRWIGFGSFEKPSHYVPGSLSSVKWFVNACIWLFVLDGGQVFPQRASPMSYFGLVFTMLVISVGLFSIRALAISSKYRRLTKAAHR